MDGSDFFQWIEADDIEQARAALNANPALLEARDRLGRSALHRAVAHGSLVMTQMLLAAGATAESADRQQETVLYTAVEHDPAIVRLLLDAGADPNRRSILGDTALFNACDKGVLENANLLIAHGAQVNLENDFSQTPLHAAASARDARMVALLAAAGAQPNTADWLGDTALHQAINGVVNADDAQACLETVDALLAAGADPGKLNRAQMSALQIAHQAPDSAALVAALEARGLT